MSGLWYFWWNTKKQGRFRFQIFCCSSIASYHASYYLSFQLALSHLCLLFSPVNIINLLSSLLSNRAGTTQRTTAVSCLQPRTISGISTTVWTSFSVTKPSTTTLASWSRCLTAWTIFRYGPFKHFVWSLKKKENESMSLSLVFEVIQSIFQSNWWSETWATWNVLW